jgi:hypothetical protein
MSDSFDTISAMSDQACCDMTPQAEYIEKLPSRCAMRGVLYDDHWDGHRGDASRPVPFFDER